MKNLKLLFSLLVTLAALLSLSSVASADEKQAPKVAVETKQLAPEKAELVKELLKSKDSFKVQPVETKSKFTSEVKDAKPNFESNNKALGIELFKPEGGGFGPEAGIRGVGDGDAAGAVLVWLTSKDHDSTCSMSKPGCGGGFREPELF